MGKSMVSEFPIKFPSNHSIDMRKTTIGSRKKTHDPLLGDGQWWTQWSAFIVTSWRWLWSPRTFEAAKIEKPMCKSTRLVWECLRIHTYIYNYISIYIYSKKIIYIYIHIYIYNYISIYIYILNIYIYIYTYIYIYLYIYTYTAVKAQSLAWPNELPTPIRQHASTHQTANCHHHPIFEPLNSSGFVGRSLWTQKTSKKEPIRLWYFYGHVQVQKIITQSWVPRFLNLSILLQSDAASFRTAARSHKRSWTLLASAAVRRKCWWKSERSLWSRCTKSTMARSSWSLRFERASMTSYGMYIHDHVHCVCVLYCICISTLTCGGFVFSSVSALLRLLRRLPPPSRLTSPHSLTHSLARSLAHSIHSLTHSLAHSLTHSLAHSLTHSLIHSHSLTHTHTHTPTATATATATATHTRTRTRTRTRTHFYVAGVGQCALTKGSDVRPGIPWAPPLLRGRRGTMCIAKGSDVRPGVPWAPPLLRGRRGTMYTAKRSVVRPGVPWAPPLLRGRRETMCILRGRCGTMCIAKGSDVRGVPWAPPLLRGRCGTMCIANG